MYHSGVVSILTLVGVCFLAQCISAKSVKHHGAKPSNSAARLEAAVSSDAAAESDAATALSVYINRKPESQEVLQALKTIKEHIAILKNVTQGLVRTITLKSGNNVDKLLDYLEQVGEAVKNGTQELGPELAFTLIQAIGTILEDIEKNREPIQELINTVKNGVTGLIKIQKEELWRIVDFVLDALRKISSDAAEHLSEMGNGIGSTVQNLIDLLEKDDSTLISAITDFQSTRQEVTVTDLLKKLAGGKAPAAHEAQEVLKQLDSNPDHLKDTSKNSTTVGNEEAIKLATKIADSLNTTVEAVLSVVNHLIQSLQDKIPVDQIVTTAVTLLGGVVQLVGGLLDDLVKTLNQVAQGLTGALGGLLGVFAKLLSELGDAIGGLLD